MLTCRRIPGPPKAKINKGGPGAQANWEQHTFVPHRTTRFHMQLKAALKASPHPDHWMDMLSLVLLGVRTSLKEDISCTAAELVYGTSLRLPGEYFVPHVVDNTDPASYIVSLLIHKAGTLQSH